MNFKLALALILALSSNLSFALYGSKPMSTNPALDAVVSLHLTDANNPKYDFFCSGVLVSPNKVLTTGHCIEVMGNEVYEQWNIFTFEPKLMKVRIKGVNHAIADVDLAPSYFEATGFEGEDLAMITLKGPVTNTRPLKITALSELRQGLPALMVVGNQMAETSLIMVRNFAGNKVVFTDGSKSGVCEGDSGGALIVNLNGQFQLAGLLSAQGKGCVKQVGFSIYPRLLK